jgi:hypothetical protein
MSLSLKSEDTIVDCFDESLMPFIESLATKPCCIKCSIQFPRPVVKCQKVSDYTVLVLEIIFKYLCRSCGFVIIKSGKYIKIEELANLILEQITLCESILDDESKRQLMKDVSVLLNYTSVRHESLRATIWLGRYLLVLNKVKEAFNHFTIANKIAHKTKAPTLKKAEILYYMGSMLIKSDTPDAGILMLIDASLGGFKLADKFFELE